MARVFHVEGIVQGVGFRPFVYRLAQEYSLDGWVRNASDGVHILVEGSTEQLEDFAQALVTKKPPAAVISQLISHETKEQVAPGFTILASNALPGERTFISPDLATCSHCVHELFDGSNRRFHYPFTNCTNCGPRFTIIKALPYDREQTTMNRFFMCASCDQEYHNPANRRFHAQPNGCFTCGPHLELRIPETGLLLRGSSRQTSDALIKKSLELIRNGTILAVKGLGGYHLVCDATQEAAVLRLRERKQRPRKPLALMMESLEKVQQRFEVSTLEAQMLSNTATPIVLLQAKSLLPRSLNCGLNEIGVMLPATPLQHLLCRSFEHPLVMTSGNISEEPIIGDDKHAQERLGKVADAFLLNNRPIVSRYDDSVTRVLRPAYAGAQERVQYVRRARGYAPSPLTLALKVPPGQTILAVGPEQKSTFCFANGEEAFLSQHLGDLSNAATFANYLKTIELYEQLFSVQPTLFAVDLHPNYLSTQWAQEEAKRRELPCVQVQHHHAHIASVIAEHLSSQKAGGSEPRSDFEKEYIGIALDGTGYGSDGTVWGGEVFIASLHKYRRFAHLEQFRLPGAAAAIKHPLRAAFALLLQYDLSDHPAAQKVKEQLGKDTCTLIERMVSRHLNSPLTSSAGRLFDAVSALFGVCTETSYEGEPAIYLEAAMGSQGARGKEVSSVLKIESAQVQGVKLAEQKPSLAQKEDKPFVIGIAGLIKALLDERQKGADLPEIARLFHEMLMHTLVTTAQHAREQTGLKTVALSGGVFNNRCIATHLPALLAQAGFEVLEHRKLPPNDGCVAHGQAVVAAAQSHSAQKLVH